MRVRMVTRTVVENKVTVLGMDLTNCEPVKRELICGVDFPNDELQQMKFLRKKFETESFSIAKIISRETCENIYGMSEENFLKVAKRLTSDRKFED